MSTLKTHNIQSPDASSVNIALAPNAGMVVTGISTFNNDIKIPDNKKILFGNGGDLEIYHESSTQKSIIKESGASGFHFQGSNIVFDNTAGNKRYLNMVDGGGVELYFNTTPGGAAKLATTNTGVTVTGTVAATAFTGDGSQLSNLPPSAPVGGSASNKVFFENDKVVSVNYQITSTKNAMTAGPVSVNAGIAVTVPSGCSWTIV